MENGTILIVMASLESIDVQFVNYSDSDSCWNKDYAYLSSVHE